MVLLFFFIFLNEMVTVLRLSYKLFYKKYSIGGFERVTEELSTLVFLIREYLPRCKGIGQSYKLGVDGRGLTRTRFSVREMDAVHWMDHEVNTENRDA